jgi:hypothetical protein
MNDLYPLETPIAGCTAVETMEGDTTYDPRYTEIEFLPSISELSTE